MQLGFNKCWHLLEVYFLWHFTLKAVQFRENSLFLKKSLVEFLTNKGFAVLLSLMGFINPFSCICPIRTFCAVCLNLNSKETCL